MQHLDNEMEFDSYRQYVNPYWYQALVESVGARTFVKGEGSKVVDNTGKIWLDLVAQYGCASLGHNSDAAIAAISEYVSNKSVNIQQWGINSFAGELACLLIKYSNLSHAKVVFGSTGSEAIETAMKLAMSATGRQLSISFEGGFHGLTLSAMQLMGNSLWAGPLPIDKEYPVLKRANLPQWERILGTGNYAAVVLELVQGIGGGYCWSQSDLLTIQDVCKRTGTKLIVDEVLTGIGRTGKWFCSNHYENFEPDMIVVSKGLTGGLVPISAVLVRDEIHCSMFASAASAKIHGSTFAANMLAVKIALFTVYEIEKADLVESVADNGAWLFEKLAGLRALYPVISAIDGMGYLVCIKFDDAFPEIGYYIFELLMANGVLVNLCSHRPNTIKLTPALNIEIGQLNEFLNIFEQVLIYVSENIDEVG